MKIRIQTAVLALLLIFTAAGVNAQKKKFFDINNNKCKENRAYYYRVIVPEGTLFKVTDYYYENNQIKMEGQYRSKKLEQESTEGDFNWYYSDGKKYKEGHYKNGKATGHWTIWYKDGQVSYEGDYEKDMRTGEWKFFHRNGAIKSKPNYIEGDLDGLYASFYDNGDKKSEIMYKKGKANGEFSTWYPGGKIKSKGAYQKDSLHGSYERYWKNGTLAYKGEFDDNKSTGTWEFFHSNGNKSCEVEYNSKGKFVKGSYFDEEGKKLSKKVMSDDLFKDAEYQGGNPDMYKAINEKLGEKMDVNGAKKDKYIFYAHIKLSVDEEGNITGREWVFPDGDDDLFYDKWDVQRFINSAIDDFPKFKPAKAYNRHFEDEVNIYYYVDFGKL